jgi:hypothetical protein
MSGRFARFADQSSPLGFPAIQFCSAAAKLSINRTYSANSFTIIARLQQGAAALSVASLREGVAAASDRCSPVWPRSLCLLPLPPAIKHSEPAILHVSVVDMHRLTKEALPVGSGSVDISSLVFRMSMSGQHAFTVELTSPTGAKCGSVTLILKRTMSSAPGATGQLAAVCAAVMLQVCGVPL